jgi:phytoene dehydrogenase-like protein
MHNVLPNSRAFPHHLGRHCRKLGVDIRLASPVVDLVTASGRVTGVTVQDARGRHEITACNGAVLAAEITAAAPR